MYFCFCSCFSLDSELTYTNHEKRRRFYGQKFFIVPSDGIADEPTVGLDPKERMQFRNLIVEIGRDNIVLLSTHILSDIKHIADTILMMKNGQLIYHGKGVDGQENLETFIWNNLRMNDL